MKYLPLLLWGLGSLFLAAEAGDVAGEKPLSSDSYGETIYQGEKDFECPHPFGSFPDPTDCAHYYVCIAGVAVHRKCGFFKNFDMLRRKCMPVVVAICGNDKTKTTGTPSVTATETTKIVEDFKCPKLTGSFPYPTDCSKYYSCVFLLPLLKTCPENQLFDTGTSTCRPEEEVNCGNRQKPDKTKTTATPSVTATETTKIVEDFKCPKLTGSFPHPIDCSKYYSCVFLLPLLKTCPENQLFDTGTSTCRPEKEVNCGNRQKPDFTTASIPTEPIVTEVPETSTTEEEITASTTETNITTEEEIIESTTEAIIGTEKITTESTTEVSSTTKFRPTGPPDHTCEEDDVDCIVTETGDVEDWFICPRDIGSFTHPSSDRLFIFCMNWIPSVRRCGQGLVYSKEHGTCIQKKYFTKLFLL